MNLDYIIIFLVLIILYLYFFKCTKTSIVKISPKNYNAAIHHPAYL